MFRQSSTDESALLGSVLLAEIAKEKKNPTAPTGDLEAQKILDSIYQPETVDLKTIRPLGKATKTETPLTSPSPITRFDPTLNLGDRYQGWLESYVLYASVDTLPLRQQIKTELKKGGKGTIRDLMAEKSLGQEVSEALHKVLKGKIIQGSSRFDFGACLSAAAGDLSFLEKAFHRIYEAYVIPWIEKRGGVATREEVIERWERIALNTEEGKKFNHSFSEREGFEGLFYTESSREEWAKEICQAALTYFPHKNEQYSFTYFIELLEREFAKKWVSYPDHFISHYLKRSPTFWVAKGHDLTLTISLAF